jgi:hypothetical protein
VLAETKTECYGMIYPGGFIYDFRTAEHRKRNRPNQPRHRKSKGNAL